MRTHQPQPVEVAFAKPYRLRPTSALRVVCLSGTAWITLDGHLADLVLSSGQSVCVAARADVLIVGLPHCMVRIDPLGAEHGAQADALAAARYW